MPITYDSIATTTLGAAASTITFSSIPSGYTDLKLVFVGKPVSGGTNFYIRFNNITTPYANVNMYRNASTVTSGQNTTADGLTGIRFSFNTTIESSGVNIVYADIFSYSGSTQKFTLGALLTDVGSNGGVEYSGGWWQNTAAVSRIDLFTAGSNFAAGSRATLYGILKA